MKIESYNLSTNEVIQAFDMWNRELFKSGMYSLIPDYDAMAVNGTWTSVSKYIEETDQIDEWSEKELQEARDFLKKCNLDEDSQIYILLCDNELCGLISINPD